MLRRTEEKISYLGIDEKSSERGHTYASILTDIDCSRVLDLVAERKLEAAVGLLETLTPIQRASVQSVAIDMWPAYMSATRQCMPQADSRALQNGDGANRCWAFRLERVHVRCDTLGIVGGV
jgi:transposase